MSSPPQNIGSDAEDGEVSESGDETVGKDTQDSSNASALLAGQSEEENGEDSSPQRKKLKLDTDDANATVEDISSPSSVAELSADDAMVDAMEEGEEPSKDKEDGEEPSREDDEEEGEEGEILSDSDEDEQVATVAETTSDSTSRDKSSEGSSSNKKGSSQDRSSRDGRRSPSPRDRYQDRRRYRHSDHSQSPSSSSRSGSGNSNHLARKGVKRPASNDRRIGADTRNRKEGSPFTKRKPKMKAPPPSTSPFWGERRHLLPNPSVSPRTGYNLDSDYPQLPRRLVKEYFPEPPIRFVRDSHNFSDYNRTDNSQLSANKLVDKDKDNVAVSRLSPANLSNEEEAEDMATQECEGTMPSLPSMQDLVKNQMYTDSNSEMEPFPPPLIEDKSLETADSLADVFSEDFPLMDGGETSEQEEAISLKKLVGGGSGCIDITIAAGEQKGNLNNKVARQVHKQLSARKQLKAAAWHAKQKTKQKDNKDHEKSLQPCKYFQNGFCKSGDSCSYSHAGPSKNRKKEVCRYYLGDNCTKGDECPYLHETFPCKFFHSRNFCIHGDSCRFSHAPLNDETRELLATVLQQDAKQPGAATPVMANANNLTDVVQPPHPTPKPTPLMSVDTSAMAPLVGGAAPPLMQQDHPPRPPWDGPVPIQPPIMMPPPQFGGSTGGGGPRQVPEPNSGNIMRPAEQKLGILPTPPAYMKLIPDNSQIPAPAMNVNPNINSAVQDPRSSCDPRMSQQQHLKRQQEQFELNSSIDVSRNETTIAQSKEQDDQAGDDDTRQNDGSFPLFQPLEPPKEISRQKPHFIPDLPSPSVGAIDNVDANLPSHIARPSSIPHHSIDQSPSRPRNLKSKYSHLKVKSRTSKSTGPSEEQSQLLASKKDSMHKSILKRTAEKPLEPFSMYLQDSIEEMNTGYGEIQSAYSNRTSMKEDSKSSSPEKAASDTDKTAVKKDSSVPYYAMFDTGFGSDLQIDSAFGSLED